VEVFASTDSDLKTGTVGFRAEDGGVRWDDLVVKPLCYVVVLEASGSGFGVC
jgi:hypothetical protein